METLRYKEYEGSVEVSIQDKCLHGRLLFVDDLITYEAETLDALGTAFKEAVDDYIQFCAEIGKQPEKPCKGLFNVRVKPEVHRALIVRAFHEQHTLNELVCLALDAYLSEASVSHNHHHVVEHVIKEQGTSVKWASRSQSAFETTLALAALEDNTASTTIEDNLEERDSWIHLKTENSVPC